MNKFKSNENHKYGKMPEVIKQLNKTTFSKLNNKCAKELIYLELHHNNNPFHLYYNINHKPIKIEEIVEELKPIIIEEPITIEEIVEEIVEEKTQEQPINKTKISLKSLLKKDKTKTW